MSKAGLFKKLAAIMAKIDRVPKNGFNSFHKYKFVQEADLSEYVRQFFVEEGLVLVMGAKAQNLTPIGDKGDMLTTLEMEITIADTETGESITVPWQGQGADKGDKGLYKAMTGGVKFWLLKTFLVPSGEDPEGDEETDRRAAARGKQDIPRPRQEKPSPATVPEGTAPATQAEVEAFAESMGIQKGTWMNYTLQKFGIKTWSAVTPEILGAVLNDMREGKVAA